MDDARAFCRTDGRTYRPLHPLHDGLLPLSEAEAKPIFEPYFNGLAMIAKSDTFYRFDLFARSAFVESLAGALHSYGGWNGRAEDFEASFHEAFTPFMPEQEHRARMLKMLTREGDSTETPLANLRSAKQLADLYLIYTARRTWRTILDRASKTTAEGD